MNICPTIITLLAVIFSTALAASAKKKPDCPHAEIRISYFCHDEHLKTDGKAYTAEYQMILLANSSDSKYYNALCEYVDSLNSTPSGKAKYHAMITSSAKSFVETGVHDESIYAKCRQYVYKSIPDSILTLYDTNGSSHAHFYTEPLGEMEWRISDSTKTVLGYECIMAETDFHGRRWTVWFSPDIPIQDGPWKLCGLPGLILEASDATGQHAFTADGIEASDAKIIPPYNHKKYEKVKRKEMLQAQRKYLLNSNAMTMSLIRNTPDGTEIDIPDLEYNNNPDLQVDFLETDYHE